MKWNINFNNWLPDKKPVKIVQPPKPKPENLYIWDWKYPNGKRPISSNPFDNGYAFGKKLEKRGYKKLGTGHYSAVYAKPNSDRVVKVCHNENGDAWIDYCLWAAQKGYAGSLAPRVYSYKKIGKFYVAIIERMSYDAYQHHIEMKYYTVPFLLNQSLEGCSEAEMLLDVVLPGAKKFAQDLLDTFKYGTLDLHSGNIMFRKDGSICVTDPVCHRSTLKVTRLRASDFGLPKPV